MPKTDVTVELVGQDGNVFSILGKVSQQLQRAGYSKEFIEEYQDEAMSGDYNNAIKVTTDYVIVG